MARCYQKLAIQPGTTVFSCDASSVMHMHVTPADYDAFCCCSFYFDALDKLQAPGVKLWLNIWARHNGKQSDPAIRLTTTAAAEFIRDGVIEFNSQSVRLVRRMPRDPDRPGYASAVPLTGEDMEQLLAFSSRGGGAKQPKKKKHKKKQE